MRSHMSLESRLRSAWQRSRRLGYPSLYAEYSDEPHREDYYEKAAAAMTSESRGMLVIRDTSLKKSPSSDSAAWHSPRKGQK